MEQENPPLNPELHPFSNRNIQDPGVENSQPPRLEPKPYRGLKWIFVGHQGLRSGWSVTIFLVLLILFINLLGFLFLKAHLITQSNRFTPRQAFFGELMQVASLIIAVAIMALIERRSILDYNLRGPRRIPHFFEGIAAGFLALSALVGALAWGRWLHFGPVALTGIDIVKYAGIWGCVFLMVACVEEGGTRCYLLYTFTRGINFWWGLGIVGIICIDLLIRSKGNGVWGVYVIALLGLLPCLLLHLRRTTRSAFWQAAWVTSTLFGFAHTGNNGENWIGIFTAAFIGFVFCVSVHVTGSAWWALGCHAGWDWGETYFWGTADSGFVAPGHLLTTHPAGAALWSGGADGPEGSLLVLPLVLLLLAFLVAFYGRRKSAPVGVSGAEPLAS